MPVGRIWPMSVSAMVGSDINGTGGLGMLSVVYRPEANTKANTRFLCLRDLVAKISMWLNYLIKNSSIFLLFHCPGKAPGYFCRFPPDRQVPGFREVPVRNRPRSLLQLGGL